MPRVYKRIYANYEDHDTLRRNFRKVHYEAIENAVRILKEKAIIVDRYNSSLRSIDPTEVFEKPKKPSIKDPGIDYFLNGNVIKFRNWSVVSRKWPIQEEDKVVDAVELEVISETMKRRERLLRKLELPL